MKISLIKVFTLFFVLTPTRLTTPPAGEQCQNTCPNLTGESIIRPKTEIVIEKVSEGKEALPGRYVRSDTLLGAGTYCNVYLGQYYKTNEIEGLPVAIRVMKKEKELQKRLRQEINLENELKIHRLVSDGEFILKLLDFAEDEDFYYFMLELVNGGDLYTKIHRNSKDPSALSVDVISDLFDQISKGVDFLHKNGVLHRDLKPRNILLQNQNGQIKIKIADFGFATIASSENKYLDMTTDYTCGTFAYMAPEISEYGLYSVKSDVFAMGVTLYAVFMRSVPAKRGELVESAVRLENKLLERNIPQKYRFLILGMLDRDPVNRFSLDNVFRALHAVETPPRVIANKNGVEFSLADNPFQTYQMGYVFEGKNSVTGDEVTIRAVKKSEYPREFNGMTKYESLLHLSLQNEPNIIRLIDVIEDENFFYFITESSDQGSMAEVINMLAEEKKPLPESLILLFFKQLLAGLKRLHELKILHRDLSLETVQVWSSGEVKISGFEFAVKLDSPDNDLIRSEFLFISGADQFVKSKTTAGSMAYLSPEACKYNLYSEKSDIYALGVVLLSMFMRSKPVRPRCDVPIPPQLLTRIMGSTSSEGKDLVIKMLGERKSSRPSFADIESHPWVTGVNPLPPRLIRKVEQIEENDEPNPAKKSRGEVDED